MLNRATACEWLAGWSFGVAFVNVCPRTEIDRELAYLARGGWTGWHPDWQAGLVAALASAVGTDCA